MRLFSLISFIVFAIGVLVSNIEHLGWINYVCKPMLMMMLFFYFFWTAYKSWLDEESKMAIALFGAWLGDIFLMVPDSFLFFVLGIGGFFLMQIYYISTFRFSGQLFLPLSEEELQHNRNVREARKIGKPLKDADGQPLEIIETPAIKGLVERYRYLVIPFALIGLAILYFIMPKLDGWILKLAIAIYASSLVGMVIAALNRGGRVPKASFIMVFVGAMLFLISDVLIAVNQFLIPNFPYANLAIMALYMPAQYLIVEGFLKQGKVQAEVP